MPVIAWSASVLVFHRQRSNDYHNLNVIHLNARNLQPLPLFGIVKLTAKTHEHTFSLQSIAIP